MKTCKANILICKIKFTKDLHKNCCFHILQGVVKTKDGKKVQIDKKLVDPRADPIPKPPQYPCARPPRNYIPAKVVPNASPGKTHKII